MFLLSSCYVIQTAKGLSPMYPKETWVKPKYLFWIDFVTPKKQKQNKTKGKQQQWQQKVLMTLVSVVRPILNLR